LPGCGILPGEAARRFGFGGLLARQLVGTLARGCLLGAFLGLALFGKLLGSLLLGLLLTGQFFRTALFG
jgi:hypothetical protein